MDYKTEILKALHDNGVIDDELYEKCSKPDYIQALPYDLRSTNLDELIDRFDACTTKMSELKSTLDTLEKDLTNELDDLVKNKRALQEGIDELGQMAIDNTKFYEADDKVLAEKRQWVNSVQERANIDYSLPNDITDEILRLHDYFEDTSWVSEADANALNDLAGRIVDFAYDQTGGDDTAWSNGVIGIADDIRVIASNDYFNSDLPSLHSNSHDIVELATALDNVDTLQRNVNTGITNVENIGVEIEKNRKMYANYYNESLNTVRKAGELGLLD